MCLTSVLSNLDLDNLLFGGAYELPTTRKTHGHIYITENNM